MTVNPPSASQSGPARRPHDGDAARPSSAGEGTGTAPNDPPEERLAWFRGAFDSPVGWPCAIDAGADAATDGTAVRNIGTVEPEGRRTGGSG